MTSALPRWHFLPKNPSKYIVGRAFPGRFPAGALAPPASNGLRTGKERSLRSPRNLRLRSSEPACIPASFQLCCGLRLLVGVPRFQCSFTLCPIRQLRPPVLSSWRPAQSRRYPSPSARNYNGGPWSVLYLKRPQRLHQALRHRSRSSRNCAGGVPTMPVLYRQPRSSVVPSLHSPFHDQHIAVCHYRQLLR